jgi:hypothetical protein
MRNYRACPPRARSDQVVGAQLLEDRASRIRIASGVRRLAFTVGSRRRADAPCLGPASRRSKSSVTADRLGNTSVLYEKRRARRARPVHDPQRARASAQLSPHRPGRERGWRRPKQPATVLYVKKTAGGAPKDCTCLSAAASAQASSVSSVQHGVVLRRSAMGSDEPHRPPPLHHQHAVAPRASPRPAR